MRKKVFCLFIVLSVIRTVSVYGAEAKKTISDAMDYCIGPEDVLEITVWKNKDLKRDVIVRPDGKISFPLIGDVVAQGRTVDELRKIVESKIQVLVPDMPVTIMVTEVGSQKIYVVGEVTKPGVYTMGKTLRVIQAIGMAGGLTAFAKKKDIIIIRNQDGKQDAFRYNYHEVAKGENLEQNIFLKSGDTIVVP